MLIKDLATLDLPGALLPSTGTSCAESGPVYHFCALVPNLISDPVYTWFKNVSWEIGSQVNGTKYNRQTTWVACEHTSFVV